MVALSRFSLATLSLISAFSAALASFEYGENRETGTPFAAAKFGVAADTAAAQKIVRATVGDDKDGVFLERRRINVRGELETFDRLDDGVSSSKVASRPLDLKGAERPLRPLDVRWGLVGPPSSTSTFQFVVVTDGEESTRRAVSSALRAAGARVCGFVSAGSFVVVGTPSAAGATRRVHGVSWVGSLTPADRTARAWDVALPALESVVMNGTLPARYGGHEMDAATFLEAAGIIVDDDGRVPVDVSFPLVSDEDTLERVLEGFPLDLGAFAAEELTRGVSDAASDPGAWVETPSTEATTVKKLIAHVSARGVSAAVAWLASHRSVHWVAPRHRSEMQNYGARYALQSGYVAGNFSRNVIWDAGITGKGQIVGVGDSGADRRSCFLSGADKFVMYRNASDQTSVDETGHGTHVCGSVAGETEAGSDNDGMAKHARIAFEDLTGTDRRMMITGSGLGDNYFAHAYAVGARVHSNSWGMRMDQSYGQLPFEIDEYAHRNQNFVPVFAVGNSGGNTVVDGMVMIGSFTVASPANAKNAIGVGASRDNNHWASVWQKRLTWHVDLVGEGAQHWKHVLFKAVGGDHISPTDEFIVDESHVHTPVFEACGDTIDGNVTGKIVFIHRGECPYKNQTISAQKAGASAVVIINNIVCEFHYMADDQDVFKTNSVPVFSMPRKDADVLLAIVTSRSLKVSINRIVDRSVSRREEMESFSSAGPTLDGRVKPDVVAPGSFVWSADKITDENFNASDTCRVVYKHGTSMATPIVAGALVLIRQYFTDGFYPEGIKTPQNAFEPSGALLKAVLINGAQPLGGHTANGQPLDVVPSCKQGWGRVNVTNSLVLPDQGELQVKPAILIFEKPFTASGQTYGVCLRVIAGEKELSATLVWTDPPSAVNDYGH